MTVDCYTQVISQPVEKERKKGGIGGRGKAGPEHCNRPTFHTNDAHTYIHTQKAITKSAEKAWRARRETTARACVWRAVVAHVCESS